VELLCELIGAVTGRTIGEHVNVDDLEYLQHIGAKL
jgi:hypothetical protein